MSEIPTNDEKINSKAVLVGMILYMLGVGAAYLLLLEHDQRHNPPNPLVFLVVFTIMLFITICTFVLVIFVLMCFCASIGYLFGTDRNPSETKSPMSI